MLPDKPDIPEIPEVCEVPDLSVIPPEQVAACADSLSPQVVAVLQQLWLAHTEIAHGGWSLAKLSKQSGLPMSVLRRQLTLLEQAGLVTVALRENGIGRAALSSLGVELCQAGLAD